MSEHIPTNPSEKMLGIFLGFYLEALRRIPRNRATILFATVATLTGIAIPELFQEGAPLSMYADAFNTLLTTNPLLAVVALFSFLLSVFSTGALVLSLFGKKIHQSTKESFSVLFQSVGIEIVYFSSALLVFLILLSPSFFASEKTAMLSQWLLIFGFLIFIPILIILTLTRIYASFHVLLSKTDIKSSIRLGYTLFSVSFRESLLFGALYLFFALLTSLLMTLISYGFTLISSDETAKTIALVAISLFLQGLFLFVGKSVWLSFFLRLNTRQEPIKETETSQNEEKVIQKEVPEAG
ncbi:MAG: hypothetical protein WCJ25_03025 [Candidatus Moraniibacteriota bacterium]